MFKLAVLVCAQALIQTISAQYIGAYNGWDAGCGWAGPGLWAGPYETCGPWAGPYDTIGPIGLCGGLGPAALAASNGAGLAVSSRSPIAPTGVSMTSENCYEGPLAVTGAIPFLGAVALEGALPTVGGGAVTYGCGNGEVAILNEDIAPLEFAGPYGYGPYGYGPYGYDGRCGCDGFGYGYGPYGRW
ncbi:chorion class B protein PC10-like [Maniola hyperantus]|uniref:chorion class B protein PC10-like n=1 Tax=Aphantopus hyperantus TaxID=2795564 RepID=UPI00156891C2|nr:chorion class B protein PC10-like [Maniola hyperantus]